MRYGAGCAMWMAVALWTGPAIAQDDGPGRGVARVSVTNGDVSVRRGDSGDWVAAAVNAPLVVQDTIATGPGSRAEVQLDYANLLRLGSNAEVRFSELEYRRYQMQVARGTVVFRVLRDSDAEVEVSTPAVSVRPSKKGSYRVTVREDGQTEITARAGDVEIYTPRGTEYVHAGKTMLVRNESSGPEFQITNAVPYDEFDRWNDDRDRMLMRSASYRYVSPSIYGADDLDPYGRWVYDAPYGYVWVPAVSAGWAPYRHGRWVWVDWYGWSWVSYDPWGWAPFHYGRWYYGRAGWCWYPGVAHSRYYWSPGLVAFIGFGGGGVGVGFGRVGWVPLGPHEPYYPWYGRGYYHGGGYVNRSVNVTNVNIVNVYRNARVTNGISGMEAAHFGRGNGQVVHFSGADLRQASVVRGQLPVGPSHESVRFADRQVGHVPQSVDSQRFYSRREPARVERVPFSEQQRRFQAGGESPADGNAGRPADNAQGWRRMNESRGNAPANAAPRNDPGTRTMDNGWRRFGDPSVNNNVRSGSTPETRAPRDAGNSESRWQGVGNHQADRPQTRTEGSAPAPRQENRGAGNSDQPRWQRFGNPGASPQAAPRNDRESNGPRNMQITPPVVRERSTPHVDAPRSMPRSEAPHASAPRMEAPRSAAPRSESHGGGGGGGPRGGGGGAPRESGGGGGGRSGGGGRGR